MTEHALTRHGGEVDAYDKAGLGWLWAAREALIHAAAHDDRPEALDDAREAHDRAILEQLEQLERVRDEAIRQVRTAQIDHLSAAGERDELRGRVAELEQLRPENAGARTLSKPSGS